MRLLDRLERRFGHLAIPNLTLIIVIGQVFAFLAIAIDPGRTAMISFLRPQFVGGEYWRLFSFVFVPLHSSPIWFLVEMQVIYLLGNILDQRWGTFRFNVYLLTGWFAAVAIAFAYPGVTASNVFVDYSIFLAFAWLYPDFVFRLMFILPVKSKWIALFMWASVLVVMYEGPNSQRLYTLAGVFNFLIFFARDIVLWVRGTQQRMQHKVKHRAHRKTFSVSHKCLVCGVDEKSDPEMEFRYCSQCEGSACYCMDHIRDHEHTGADETA